MLPAYSLSGQDTTAQSALIEVLVTDFQGNSKKGEQILFEGIKSGIIHKGVSDRDGAFDIYLPGGDTYLIKLKSIGEATDYSRLVIPGLNPGESYTPGQVTIEIEPPKQFTLDNVHFDFAKATLTADSYTELEELLEFMRLREVEIEIGGHTDDIGNNDDNLDLSRARADAVKQYLVSNGIPSERIRTIGYGEERPIDTNNTPEGRQKNRRTEVRIINE